MIQQKGQISRLEMYRVFNMGIGMIAIIAAEDAAAAMASSDPIWRIGDVIAGDRTVAI